MPTTTKSMAPIQWTAAVLGAVFVLIGIAGFIPGLTTGYDSMAAMGPASEAMLLGLFQVSVLHNVVHLLYGIIGLAAATSHVNAYWYLVAGGVVYLLLWLYGMLMDPATSANFVPLNTADNWLHLLLGAVMVGLGLSLRSKTGRDLEEMAR